MLVLSRRWLVPTSVVVAVAGLASAAPAGALTATAPRVGPTVALGGSVAWGTTVSAPAGAQARLFGVTAAAPGDVWAVGGQNPGASPTQVLTRPYAEHWTGKAWVATSVPLPAVYPAGSQAAQLESAASTGPSDVWAVGHVDSLASLAARTLAYHWDGTAWSRTPTPNPAGATLGNRLLAVAARSSNDVYAVGGSGFPARSLVLRWTGSAWSQVATPSIGSLSAVAVNPSTVWVAAGATVQALTGGVWTRLPAVPAGSGSVSISGLASSSTGLWAVGTDLIPYFEGYLYRPYAAVWNGARWTKVNVPGSSGLNGVTTAGSIVFASSATDVARLTPTAASLEVTPPPGSFFLEAIAADPLGQPWAVGWVGSGGTVVPAIINAPGIGQGGISVTTGYSGASVTWIGPRTGSGTASVSGGFQVGGLVAGSYTIVVSAPGCTPAVAAVSVASGLVSRVDARVSC